MLKKFLRKISKKANGNNSNSDTIPKNPNKNPVQSNNSTATSPLPSQTDPSQISTQQKNSDLEALMKGSVRAQSYKQKKHSQPSLDNSASEPAGNPEKGLGTTIPNPFRDNSPN
jgi:hypothetical protein